MNDRPLIRDIALFLAAVRRHIESGAGPGALAEEKASLLERIADARPDDTEARQMARDARTAADQYRDQ